MVQTRSIKILCNLKQEEINNIRKSISEIEEQIKVKNDKINLLMQEIDNESKLIGSDINLKHYLHNFLQSKQNEILEIKQEIDRLQIILDLHSKTLNELFLELKSYEKYLEIKKDEKLVELQNQSYKEIEEMSRFIKKL